jgi:AcrR family transcriptional regulator
VSIYDPHQHFQGDMTIEPLTRARRREMTRTHLLEAAAVVFARDGFHGASLDAVAATAGFTKGAVYSNFNGKDDLFLAVLDDRLDQLAHDMQQALAEPIAADGLAEQLPRVRGVIERTWDDEWTALYLEFVLYARRNPDAREKLATSRRRDREITINMLEEQYSGKGVAPEFSVPVLALISTALFEGLSLGRLVDPEAFTHETLTESLKFLYTTIGVNDDVVVASPPDDAG